MKLIYGMVWNEKVVIKFELFSSLDSESEDEETKNKQLMTSKLAKTLDELCTKVSEFFIYIYFQRALESKVYYLMKEMQLTI